MEGRPWLRITLTFAAFVLLGIPVWSITQPKEIIPVPKKGEAATQELLQIKTTFSQAPASFLLEYLGHPILTGTGPATEFSYDWKIAVPAEGVDLLIKSTWPAPNATTAVRVQVMHNESPVMDQTFWTSGDLVETITIPGNLP